MCTRATPGPPRAIAFVPRTVGAILLLLPICAPLRAEIVTGPADGAPSWSRRETDGPFIRPLDDSDPEMRTLLETFFDTTPCGVGRGGICPEALALLTGGGERLAAYLVRQVEANRREGHPSQGTYLRLLGHTESRTAFLFLRDLVRRSGDGYDFLFAIEALGRTRDRGVVRELIPILETSRDPEVLHRCAIALANVETKHGPLPEARAALDGLPSRMREPAVEPVDGFDPVAPGIVVTRDPGADCKRSDDEAYALRRGAGIRSIHCTTLDRVRGGEDRRAVWLLRWADYQQIFSDETGAYIGGGRSGPYRNRGIDIDRLEKGR